MEETTRRIEEDANEYRQSDDRLSDILKFSTKPTTKLTLLTIAINSQLPSLTVKEINEMTDRTLTLEDYKEQLEVYKEFVIPTQKKYKGVLRHAFRIDYAKMLSYIERNENGDDSGNDQGAQG